jgi:hypothetical protein
MKVKLILPLAFTIFLFNGCEEVRYIYLRTPCPKLQTYDLNLSEPTHFNLRYWVEEGEINGTK